MSLTFNHPDQTITPTNQLLPLTLSSTSGLILPKENDTSTLSDLNGIVAFIDDSPLADYTGLKDQSGNPVDITFNNRLHFRHNDSWYAPLNQDDLKLLKSNADYEINTRYNSISSRITALEAQDQIPYGLIVAWYTTSIPTGWAICNGQTVNGRKTPDLRDRFIFGSSSTNTSGGFVGATPSPSTNLNIGHYGGESTNTLTTDQMPSHKHVMPWGEANTASAFYGTWRSDRYGTKSGNDNDNRWKWTSPTGGGKEHNNMPPFYCLQFIMLVG